MNFSDVFKNKFLSQFAVTSPIEYVLALVFSILVGLIIYFVYKKTYNGVAYSHNFNMSLILMTLITTIIIFTITANPVLSLGMVGALSIIRFRTVVKDPVDLMYLFWAISMGIIIGAKQYIFALICVIIITIFCFIMCKLSDKEKLYLVIVRYDVSVTEAIDREIEAVKGKIRNRTVGKSGVETIIEVKNNAIDDHFVEKITKIEGVESAALVNYNGDYAE